MNRILVSTLCLAIALAAPRAFPDETHEGGPDDWDASRPDSHAPIMVMGDHTHETGEWMASYRYGMMRMSGNIDGTSDLTVPEVLADPRFMIAPTEMDMEMQMIGLMWAPTERLTLAFMAPHIRLTMDHLTMAGTKFTTRSEGFGDIRATGLVKLYDRNNQRLHLNLGVSVPTGSINERDRTPVNPNAVLPYPMQLGSGTFDLHPGFTYLGQHNDWSWGGQVGGTIRLGQNNEGYSLGERGRATFWGAHKFTDWLSASLRLNGEIWDDVDGRDRRTFGTPVPTAKPNLRGGERVDALVGVNFYFRKGALKGNRIAIEYGMPIYQSLDGPQLEVDDMLQIGWQLSWGSNQKRN